jgi:hypothetical protein
MIPDHVRVSKEPVVTAHTIFFDRYGAYRDDWHDFVSQFSGGIQDAIAWLTNNYNAQFQMGLHGWWIVFPDAETKCAFELTWMHTGS